MVYVLAQDGTPLMPTKRYGKVRHLLEDGRAKVVKRTPFTIQLLYPSAKYVQPVTLGVDAGSKHIGLSATTESEELYASDVELRNDIVKKLSSRRAFRRARRSRKTRCIGRRDFRIGGSRKGGLRRLFKIKFKHI